MIAKVKANTEANPAAVAMLTAPPAVEILHVDEPADQPEQWHFRSADLQRALAARRLERDFDANLDTAALILDLQDELRHLRAVLGSRGIR